MPGAPRQEESTLPGSKAPLHGQNGPAGSNQEPAAPGPSAGAAATGGRGILSYTWLAPLVSAITAFAVGLYDIARPSLWRDEAYTIEAASRSPGQILALLKNADAVHGAYYLCMHVVVTVVGRSATAVRLPSVVATAVAAAFVAALSMRVAAAARTPWPRTTALLAGLLYAISPSTARYAQEARSYATVSALVVIASYLLVRAFEDPRRRRWWVGYGAAMALAGLFNLLALLVVPAHGITAAIVTRRSRAARRDAPGPATAGGSPTAGGLPTAGGAATAGDAPTAGGAAAVAAAPSAGGAAGAEAASVAGAPATAQEQAAAGSAARSWAAAVIVALVALAPLAVVAYLERGATAWLGQPGSRQIRSLVMALAGSVVLTAPVGALIVAGVAASLAAGRRRPVVTTADVALPWLVLPPAILLVASQFHPLYNFRYVVCCLPAVALLAAEGLRWLASCTARFAAKLASGPALTAAAWVPSLAVVALIAAASVPPQQAIRQPWSRPDYLRKVSKIVARYGHVGDAVLYITDHSRIVSQGYPGPFRKLRDIALADSPVASATLNGTEVSAAVLRTRFASVSRVWVISDNGPTLPAVNDALDVEKLALVKMMRAIGRWHTRDDLLLLFARR